MHINHFNYSISSRIRLLYHASNKVFDIKFQLVFNKLLNMQHIQWKFGRSCLMKFIRKVRRLVENIPNHYPFIWHIHNTLIEQLNDFVYTDSEPSQIQCSKSIRMNFRTYIGFSFRLGSIYSM